MHTDAQRSSKFAAVFNWRSSVHIIHCPDDTMHLLMQVPHEEPGLPERKTINLTTSINIDLGCDASDASHLMGPWIGILYQAFMYQHGDTQELEGIQPNTSVAPR